jgi:hypothetical protein
MTLERIAADRAGLVIARGRMSRHGSPRPETRTMKKLALQLDDLTVESFETVAAEREAGTVFGEQCTCYTNCSCPGVPTCDETECAGTCGGCCTVCWDTCDGASCELYDSCCC